MPDETWIQKAIREANEQGTVAGGQVTAPQEPQVVGPTTQSNPPKLTWEQRNTIPGIPIRQDLAPPVSDRIEDLAGDIRTKTLMRKDPEEKKSYLEGFYGKGNVRIADDGITPLILTPSPEDPTRMVEIPLIGPGFQLKDIGFHLAATTPEMIGAAIGSKAGFGKGLVQLLSTAAGATAGQFVGEVSKDVAVSDAAFKDILMARSKEAVGNLALNTALGVGTKVATWTPFGAKTPEGLRTADAARYLENKFGVGPYPMTPGETLDSSLLRRGEAVLGKQPGSSAYFDKIQRQRVDWWVNVQNKMLSSKLDSTDIGMLKTLEEDVGDDVIQALRQKMEPVQAAEALAKNTALQVAHQSALDEASQATGIARQEYPNLVGQSIRTRIVGDLDRFKTEAAARYEAAYGLPGGRDKILSVSQLADDAEKLIKKLPSVEHTIGTPENVVNLFGQPVTTTATGEVLARPFIPSEVRSKLQFLADLKNLNNPVTSLEDLVRFRTAVSDDIKRGTALANVDTKYLNDIRSLLTKTIQDETAKMPGGQLKQAWERANQFYSQGDTGFAKGIGAFEERNVNALLKERDTGGFVADEDIVKNIKPEEYNSYKEFLGTGSQEFKQLQSSIVDQVLQKAKTSLSGPLFDGPKLRESIFDFMQNKRQIAEDILGPDRLERLKRIGTLMEHLKPGDQISTADFQDILASNRPLRQAVDTAVDHQKDLNALYRSSILQDVASGKLGQRFDTTEFINRFYENASPKELELIKAKLATDFPDKWEQLQRKISEKMLSDANNVGKGPVRTLPGEPFKNVSSSRLEQILGDEQNRARLKIILGDDYQDFVEMAVLMRSSQSGQQAFQAAGGIRAGMQIAQMAGGNVAGYAEDYFRQKLMGLLYFGPVRSLLVKQNLQSPEAQLAALRTVMTSEPFLKEVSQDMGHDADKFMSGLWNALNARIQRGPAQAQPLKKMDWIQNAIDDANRNQTNINRQRVFQLNP